MKVVLRGTCSECYQTTDLHLSDKDRQIICPTCGHAVPALEDKALRALSKDQGKRRLLGALGFFVFLAAVGLFIGFIVQAEPAAGQQFKSLSGQAQGMLGGSALALVISMALGFVASNRSYICEF